MGVRAVILPTHLCPKMSRARWLTGLAGSALAVAAARARGKVAVCDAAAEGGGQSRVPASVEMHCSPISPTCGRYKAFFALQKVPVKVIDTLPLVGDGMPRIVADGADVADLTGLVAQLRAASMGAQSGGVRALADAEEEAHWIQWADEKLIPHVFINVFRSPNEAAQAMDTAVLRGDFNIVYSTFLRQIGPYYMYSNAKMAKRKMEVSATARIHAHAQKNAHQILTSHAGEHIELITCASRRGHAHTKHTCTHARMHARAHACTRMHICTDAHMHVHISCR